MVVHSILPEELTVAARAVLEPAGLRHVAHGDDAPVAAAARAAADDEAIAVLGPLRSADVAEAVEATAPAGLPLLAPVATWAGVTRDDEPGCEDPARHAGTVLRMVARDTVVAQRIAAELRSDGLRTLVVAGDHDYGRQLDEQLERAGLPRAERPDEADVLVLAALAGEPEIARAAALAPLPVIAFDGVQGSALGDSRDVRVALPFAPASDDDHPALFAGVRATRRAAELLAASVAEGSRGRGALLTALRVRGGFDDHGDPLDPAVWLWRAGENWTLMPDRALVAR